MMGLFKRRLGELGKFILTLIIYVGFLISLVVLLALIPHTVGVIIAWVIIGPFALLAVCVFIHWLFIEPFRKESAK